MPNPPVSSHLVIVNVSVGVVIPHTEQAHQAVIRHLVTKMLMNNANIILYSQYNT